jgi:hypothetical protein
MIRTRWFRGSLSRRHRRGFLGRGDHLVNSQHASTLLHKPQRHRATIADAFAGALPGPENHRNLSGKAHGRYSTLSQVAPPDRCRGLITLADASSRLAETIVGLREEDWGE